MIDPKNFLIIIGGNRCGTTSLFHYLADHPQIISTKEKESRFFLDPDYEISRRSKYVYDGKMETYLQYFPEQTVNEQDEWYLDSSPDFLYSKGTPDRIKEFFNNHTVVLVAILRDPIDRFMSWYKYDKQLGNISQSMTLKNYFKKNIEIAVPNSLNRLKTGCYSLYLEQYLELFSDSLLVYRFEQLKQNPNQLIQNILDDTGLNKDYFVKDTSPQNASKEIKFDRLNTIYMNIRNTFQNAIPENGRMYAALKKGSKFYQKLNYKSSDNDKRLSKEMHDKLASYYENEYQKLKNI